MHGGNWWLEWEGMQPMCAYAPQPPNGSGGSSSRLAGQPGQGRFGWLTRWWNRGPWQKAAVIGAIPLIAVCGCCSAFTAFAATPYGQQIVAEGDATSTAQAVVAAQATQQAQIYALTHPAPTATATSVPPPTATAAATSTPAPTMTPLPTATPAPTATPRPAPTATPKPTCSTDGAPPNPWCYTFAYTGKLIYNPPGAFCDYFNCIPSFWTNTNGYVEECQDGDFSHSGGRSGSCSYHGGNLRPLYQP
jgi:hypothetical protein